MNPKPQLPSDGQLVVAAQNGMGEAWNELRRRHGGAVVGVARAEQWFGAKQRAQRALEQLHEEIVGGETRPDDEMALRSIRARAIAALTGGTYGPAPAEPGTESSTDVELPLLARAFSKIPEPWQTALWHKWVELQPAAEYAPLLGRTANEATAVVHRAEAGLFDGFLREEMESDTGVADECVPIVPLLGGSLRMTLSAHEQRLVDDHVEHHNGTHDALAYDADLDDAGAHHVRDADVATGTDDSDDMPDGSSSASSVDGDPDGAVTGCAACRRRLAVGAALSSLVPLAVVPQLTGLSPVRYRAAVGSRTRPAGAAALNEERTERARRYAMVGAAAALLLAVVAAAVLIRNPFDNSITTATIDQNTTVASSTEVTPTTEATESTAATTEPSTVPPTTEIDLRPPPTGPENRIDLVFLDNPAGFAPAPSDLSVTVTSPAPIFAGGTGTIDVAITNSSVAPTEATFRVQVPRGVELEALVEGVGECVDPPDDSATCVVPVAEGTTAVISLRFSLTSSVVGRFVVGSNLVTDELEVAIDAITRLVHSSVGRGDIVMIGNTLMTCSESDPSCIDARNGVGDVVNRWDLPAEPVQVDSSLGWVNSSSAMLDTGGATVEAAYVFWSGDLKERGVELVDDGRSRRVSILAPNAEGPVEIEAERIRLGDVDATQYFGSADVTGLVVASGDGSYVVGNVQSVEEQGSYAGWSLVVITRNPELPRRQLVVTSPFAWFSPDDSYATDFPVPPRSGQVASLDVLAFEGEQGFVPEGFTANGVPFGGEAVFDSTIIGARNPEFVNNLGIDVDAYDLLIDTPDGALRIEATSGKDGVRVSVLGLAVDLE
ncbi:MAG: hypothetical protein HKN44_08690 [Ilumatobacter sp.]|nr:hypothetical protein [Ilumatobacter sp.]